MTDTLYGFPITTMDMDSSYFITWKKVTLVIHNKNKKIPKVNELFIDIISNTGAKGEGIALLCHILRKFKQTPESGVNDTTIVRLFASGKCRDSACKSNVSINESRYSTKNMNLVNYYQRYGFEQESEDDFWMQTTLVKLLAKCQEGGFMSRQRSRQPRRSSRSIMSRQRSRQPRRSSRQPRNTRRNKKSRRNI